MQAMKPKLIRGVLTKEMRQAVQIPHIWLFLKTTACKTGFLSSKSATFHEAVSIWELSGV